MYGGNECAGISCRVKRKITSLTFYLNWVKIISMIGKRLVPVLAVLLIGLAVLTGILWQKVSKLEKALTGSAPSQATTGTTAPNVTLDTIKDLFSKDLIKFGDANRKVLFVEVTDPSCPYCHAAAGQDPELNTQMGDQFKLVSQGGKYIAPVAEMRKLVDSGKASFVLIYSPGHNNGEMGMKALYCANEKGKFWQAHDLLMNQAGYNLLNDTVKNDKTQSGTVANFLKNAVDPAFLKSCLDSGKYDARLAADEQVAATLGYQGTPDFFVNATNYPGAVSYDAMKSVVDAALK